jgi:hypothetical protein
MSLPIGQGYDDLERQDSDLVVVDDDTRAFLLLLGSNRRIEMAPSHFTALQGSAPHPAT